MSEHLADSRRRFIRLVVGGTFVVPLAGLYGVRSVNGSEKSRLDPASDRAQQLSYTHDADSSTDPARKEGSHCGNCVHFRGDEDAQWALCNIFPEHLVNVDGWCKSWFSKSG